MNSQTPVSHPSYKKHRRQFWLQIFLPMLVSILIIVVVATLTGIAAFGENGDAPLWAAISTIWLVIPAMIFGLIFLVILLGIIYLLARALEIIPPYTAKAQYYVNRATDETKRFSDMATKPVLFIDGLAASVKTFFGQD